MRYAFEACAVRSLVSVTIIAKGIVLLKNQWHIHHPSSQKPATPKAIPISEFRIKDILYYLYYITVSMVDCLKNLLVCSFSHSFSSCLNKYGSFLFFYKFPSFFLFPFFFPLLSFFFFLFWERVSIYSSGCPVTHSVNQVVLEFRYLPAFQIVGLKLCVTIAKTRYGFLSKWH